MFAESSCIDIDCVEMSESEHPYKHVVLENDRVAVSRSAVKRSRLLTDAAGDFDAIPLPKVSRDAFDRWVKQNKCDADVDDCLEAVQVRQQPMCLDPNTAVSPNSAQPGQCETKS